MYFINKIKVSMNQAEINSFVTSFAQAMQLEQSQSKVPCIRAPVRQISQHLTLEEICLSTGAEVFGGTHPNGPFQRNTRNLRVSDVTP